MRIKKIIKLFKKGNVCVTGLRGTGKDVLFGNIIARRKLPYVSNLDYGGRYAPYIYNALDTGNTYKELNSDNVKYYKCPYPRGTDIYISDAGIYYPSQYCNELNKAYPGMPVYQALCRQLSHNNFHINVQNLNRCWDKIREQSDIYILCRSCKIISIPLFNRFPLIGKLFKDVVFQRIIIYDKYESCLNRVKPNRVRVPLLGNKQAKMSAKIYADDFENKNGKVKAKLLIYKNKSKHDTYYFEKMFQRGINEKI